MGEIAVLHAQNCLRNHKKPQFDPKQRRNPNFSKPKSKSNPNQSRSRRFSSDSAKKSEKNNLVMGQVKILKRGEAIEDVIETMEEIEKVGVVDLSPKVKELEDLLLSTTDRLGPEPEMVPRFADLYAGYAFVDSPPPSCLPLPGFFNKPKSIVDVDATSDIRRILRLDLG